MASVSTNSITKLPPLQFSRELFADYWTAVISRVRQDDECDKIYSGVMKHPLIALQQKNQQQILAYHCTLVPEEVLRDNPIQPAEFLVAAIVIAAKEINKDPPLDDLWDVFQTKWPIYKRAQRKIYATIIATLQVGTSMHYARAVNYGAGTRLMQAIYEDNCRNTTRSLFALFGSLFTLKAKPGETFDSFKVRFDLIIGRFANWNPPIVLPKALLLFFALRGLPDNIYGPQKHIILAIKNVTLERGFQLLRDAGSDEANLITSTLGSGDNTNGQQSTMPTPPPATDVLATIPPPAPTPDPKKPKKTREQRMTALCKKFGPCTHHGPKSLHATSECRDPQLLRRKKKSRPVPVQNIHASPAYPPLLYHPSAASPYPLMRPPAAMTVPPPMMYQPPMHPYVHPPQYLSPPQPPANSEPMLLIQVNGYDGYDADTESEDEMPSSHVMPTAYFDSSYTAPDYSSWGSEETFELYATAELHALIATMDEDDDYDAWGDATTESEEPTSAVSSADDSCAESLPLLVSITSDSESDSDIIPPLHSAGDNSDTSDDSLPLLITLSDSDTSLSAEFSESDDSLPPMISETSSDSDDEFTDAGSIYSDISLPLLVSPDCSSDESSDDDDSSAPPPIAPSQPLNTEESGDEVGSSEPPALMPRPSSDYESSGDESEDGTPAITRVLSTPYDPSQRFYRQARAAPGKYYGHVAKNNPFDIRNVTRGLLHVTANAFLRADNFRMPFTASPAVPMLIITPNRSNGDESPPPPPPPPESPSPTPSSETEDEDPGDNTAAAPPPLPPRSSEFDDVAIDDNALASLVPDDPVREKPQGEQLPLELPSEPPASPSSDHSETLPYDPADFISTSAPPPKPRRRKCHHWSQKGTKSSRRAKRVKEERMVSPPPAHSSSAKHFTMPPASPSSPASREEHSSSAKYLPPASPSSPATTSIPENVSPARPRCAADGCNRFTGKRKYGAGYFKHCWHCRHLDHSSPHVYASPPPSTNVLTPNVENVTNHHAASSQPAAVRERSLDLEPQIARLRRARCTYAYAQGLHTVLHYPQKFVVTLRGEPAIRDDWSVAPCMISGNAQPARAIRAVLRTVTNPELNPKSMCNHIGCVYNLGDLLTRRQRHLDAIKSIDRQLASHNTSVSSAARTDVYLITHGRPNDVILDSGAGRHLHNRRNDFSTLRTCPAQTLTGFTGSNVRISQSGRVRNFEDVLLMPSAHASVRSVGYALDARGGAITFTTTHASYISPSGSIVAIARRNNNGLYAVIPNTMPPPPPKAPMYISVPTQVRREAIHRLHQCLGHASTERMRYILKNAPQVCGSLTTRDLALFTTCAACQLGKCSRAPKPKEASTRSPLFGHRLHADTTGAIRPATTGGYRRALFVVDDASRWIFVVLLRTATMHECAAAFTSVLQAAASDAHVLRTQIVRTDNGTEFVNSAIADLFAQAGIRHERTCPHTSHQNGVAERAIGRIMPLVRTFLAAASAKPTLWGEALLAAIHVTNRMPCSSNADNMSPYQIRYGRPPTINHLQPWGITAYVRRTNPQSKVFQRADAGMFVGYGHEVTRQKGWRVHLPTLRQVVTSTNVTFDTNLDESVQRRSPDQRSVTLPEEVHYTDDAPTITTPAVPLAPPPELIPPPPTASAPPASVPTTAAAPSPPVHPICARPSSTQPLVPSVAEARGPVTRSIARRTGASWSDVIRRADADIAKDAVPLHPRPRGRPPSNHEWDAASGAYVPINIAVTSPSINTAWILAAMNQELVADHATPTSYEEAVSGPDAEQWKAAIAEELSSLKQCAVWKVVLLSTVSRSCKAIPTKWVFKLKSDGAGKIARFKARLVVCGYRQKFGRDYDQTFAPVAHAASIRLILALAVAFNLHLRQFDVKTAFLYGVLPAGQRVYLLPPKGVPVAPGHVLALHKAMYGLKQAPLLWNRHLHSTLLALSFVRSHFDPCVYYRKPADGLYIYIAVVVDDILVASSSRELAEELAVGLRKVYTITDLGQPRRLVGINITPVKDGIQLDQCQFVRDVAAEFKQTKCKPVSTPIAPGSVPVGASPDLPPGHRYLSLVGSLLWASVTRPDIAVAVSIACAKSAKPTKADLAAAIRILRYLLHSPSIKLTFVKSSAPVILVFCDSAWANAPKARSRFGYIVCIHGCPVIWESKLSTMVCLSTAEAEYVAAVHAVKSALWLARLMSELCHQPVPPVWVLEDNQACIKMATNPVVSSRNRHFAMRMWWLRDQVEKRTVILRHLATDSQLADVFTKILPSPRFLQLRDHLMSGRGAVTLTAKLILSTPGGGVSKDTSILPASQDHLPPENQ